MRNAWLKMAKNQRNAQQNPEATLLSKNNWIYSKKQAKTILSVFMRLCG